MNFVQPKNIPEANIQAKFYMRCHEEGIPCVLEYKVPGSRFDAVIHDTKTIKWIVEFKNLSERARNRRLLHGRKYKQIERYEAHGVPIILVLNQNEVEQAINKIKIGYSI